MWAFRRQRPGFTLIELLIVIVIVGILAAVAIAKYASARERAYIASMSSDLRSFALAQEIYYPRQSVYAWGPPLLTLQDVRFQTSKNVTIDWDRPGDGQAWTAVATHALAAANVGCAIYIGNLAIGPVSTPGGKTATTAGAVVCD